MDQEKFDQHLMDYLFDELDEVTSAAMRRKIDTDTECRELVAGLRATLEVGQLPLEEPSDDLEERILAAAQEAQEGQPWHVKLLRSLSWAGSHAMRPQLAMAAVLVLVLGSSVLLLRARPGAVAVTPIKERTNTVDQAPEPAAASPEMADQRVGSPLPAASAADNRKQLARGAKSGQPDANSAPPDEPSEETKQVKLDERYERGLASYRAGRHAEAQRDFATVSGSSNRNAASASLYEARAVRANSGCGKAVEYFTKVRQRYGTSGVGADATWEQADCHRLMGQTQQARQLWLSLKTDPAYGTRAVNELSSEGTPAGGSGKGYAAPKKAPPAAPAPRRAAPQLDAPTNAYRESL